MYDFLGKSLRAGHIPAWNPFVLGGTPFAADPQSGWMQVLPMILFTALSAGTAIRWLVVIQPILGGLGLYAFLRSERTSRAAATIGGLALALVIAGSNLPVSIRFPGALGWTAVSLAACSRYLRAERWSARILWGMATAAAWGQVAASHLTVGLLIGTGALVAFVLARALSKLRRHEWTGRTVAGLAAFLLIALPLVNLAYLLPRLAFGPETSLALGYQRLRDLSRQLTGTASPAFPGLAAGPKWPLDLATFPGRYLGASALLLAFAGFWSRRYRHLAIGFAAYGAGCYALGLRVVANNVPSWLQSRSLVDQYLHEPYWLSFGVLLAVGVLAGIGVEAWREARPPLQRALTLAPAIIVWLVLPVVVGAHPDDLLLLVVAGVVSGAVLLAGLRYPLAMAVLPVLLVAEIVFTVALGSSGLPFKGDLKLLADLDRPTGSPATYLSSTPLSRVLSEHPGARYYTTSRQGVHPFLDPSVLQNNESMIQGLENLGGYQAVQLRRYWMYVRRVQRIPMRYNYALFRRPIPSILDVLDVGLVIARADQPPESDLLPLADDGPWMLYRRRSASPRVTVLTTWTVVRSADQALEVVARPDFQPSASAVLEEDPGIARSRGARSPPTATYRGEGNQAVRVEVNTPVPAIVLVRNVWDRDWQAAVDGRRAKVLPADYVIQAVAVGPGRHTILLTYDDPSIGFGMLGSAAALTILLAAAVVMIRRERRALTRSGGP